MFFGYLGYICGWWS